MENKLNSNTFKCQLEKINDESIRNFTKEILDLLPDYIYIIPASSTGKYHPEVTRQDGGLVLHKKIAFKIGEALFENKSVRQFGEIEKDMIRSAILLHDGLKNGLENSKYTVPEHPILMTAFIKKNLKNIRTRIKEEHLNQICNAISSHMGQWNTNRAGDEILPKPNTPIEKMVHLCDYLASKQFYENLI